MDMSLFIILWIVFIVVQNVLDKKKPRPPQNLPPQDADNFPGFEIPTLANDPNFPGEEQNIYLPSSTQAAEVREINLSEIYRQKKLAAQAEKTFSTPQVQTQPVEVEQKNFSLDLTPSATMNAIILGEILNKPKCRR